jgi:hypothetical protein
MKIEIITPKRGRKCSYCSTVISKGQQFLETTSWFPGAKFPDKKNVCWDCAEQRVELIPKIELLLVELKAYKRRLEKIQTQYTEEVNANI